MDRIYSISGIGADRRIFRNLCIDNYVVQPIPWLPFDRNDSLADYAHKLSMEIPDENPVILGLSFGGMLATEIGKIRKTKKIFLVSSAKRTADLPRIGRLALASKILELIPANLFKKPKFINFGLVGAKSQDDRELLRLMMNDMPAGFIKWALKAVVEWNNTLYPPGIVQIHGTGDRIIPPVHVHPDYWIKDGSHIMVYNRAAEVSKIIAECLSFS